MDVDGSNKRTDTSRVTSDDSRGVIYDCNIFTLQAKGHLTHNHEFASLNPALENVGKNVL